jgi:hypothetical protein
MRTSYILVFVTLVLLASCSPRDYLTRRLAADLIVGSETFREQKQIALRTGVLSNEDYLSPEYLPLQHHGWVSATNAKCPPQVAPAPCWEVMLTPAGVETFQSLIASGEVGKQTITVLAARRELIAITGIAKQGDIAEVEFSWRWVPLNELGAAFYSREKRYESTVSFREYDDGWRLLEGAHPALPLDEALKNTEHAQ